MRRLFWLALVPASLAAQRPPPLPAVSPALPRVWTRDTTLSVWLFARPEVPLTAVAARATALGGRVRVQSRWLHAVSADVPASGVRTLAQDVDLRRIQPVVRFRRRSPLDRADPERAPYPGVAAPGDSCGPVGDPVLGPSEMPYRRLNLLPLRNAGYDGTGVRVALFDTGFDTSNPAFAGVSVVAQRDFVFSDGVVRDQAADFAGAHDHGTAVWSLFAGNVPGRLRGIARGATYLLAKTEDVRSETQLEEDNYVAALEWADSIGVDIVSSSLAYLSFDDNSSYMPSDLNGDVAVTTVAADIAARNGILVITAMGNTGPAPRSLWTPADADSVLSVGAEDSLGNLANFSGRGPSADGRIKPDFTAPGVLVCVVTGHGDVDRQSGTSFATPLLAAAATLLKQVRPTFTPMDVRAAFRASASNRAAPDSFSGWGRPDVAVAAGVSSSVTPITPLAGPLASITPTFTWTSTLAGPVTFRLRIASDSTFAAPVVDTMLGSDTTLDLVRALKPGSMFWRVDGTTASETASTGRVGPLVVPAWATLTSLSDPAGTVTDSVQPTFTWTSPPVAAPPGPFTYDLFVQRVSEAFPEFGVAGLTGLSFRLPGPLERNTSYRWFLVAHLGSDTSLAPSLGPFLVLDASIPAATLLYQNFPNPFPNAGRDSTCLWFDLATTGVVEVEILDLRGNTLRRFVPGPDFPALLTAGRYGRGVAGGATCDPRLTWDGRTGGGRMLPAGVYLYKLKAPGVVLFKRIVFRGK